MRSLALVALGMLLAAVAASDGRAQDGGADDAFEAKLAEKKQEIARMDCGLADKSCLSDELKRRFELDQWLRRRLDEVCGDKSGEALQTCQWDIFERYIIPVDETNLERVRAIYERHGWPAGEGWKPIAEKAVWFIIQHNPGTEDDLMGEVLPHVKAAVEAGRLKGWYYAAMYDRRERYNGRRQYYGTQFHCQDGRYVPQKTRERDTLDQRRAELGMEPVAEKAKAFGSC